MSLITNNISGSSSGNWQIGLTGSVVISDRPTVATFPVLPGDVSLFIDGTKRTVVKGDSTLSGSMVVSGSTILAGAVSLAGNSQTVTHTGTGALTIASTAGNVIVEGTIFNGNDVTVAGDLAVNGGDLTTTAATFALANANATTVNIGAGATAGVNIGNASGDISLAGSLKLNNNTLKSSTGTPITLSTNSVTVAGDLAVNGGDLTTGATTFNLLNATATTLNVGSAATTINAGAPGVSLRLGNVLTGTTDQVTVKGNLQIDGNNIKSSGGTYTPITLSSTTNNTTLNGNLYVGDGSAGSGGGDIVLQPSLSPVNSADITTTSTTANLFSADASGGLGTATVNVGKSGGTNKVVIGNNLKIGGNKILSSGDYEAITLSSTSKHTTLNGYLYVGDGTANGGDMIMSPGPGEAADIVTDSTTGNVFSSGTSLPTTVKIGSGATVAMEVGPATGKATKIMGDLQVAGNNISGSSGVTALTLSNANVYVSGSLYVGQTTAAGGGDIILRPPVGSRADVSTTSTTAYIFDSTTTTVNIGTTDASSVSIGKSGTTNTLTVGGIILAANQTSFMALSSSLGGTGLTLTPTATEPGDLIKFDTENFDIGGNFSLATETFTAPKTGKYYFSTSVRIGTVDLTSQYYALRLVTSNATYLLDIKDPRGMTGSVANWTLMGSVVTDMDIGDTAKVYVQQNSTGTGSKIAASGNSTYFCGYLLG